MDIVINLLIWVHILAFVAGGSNSVVGPVIARDCRARRRMCGLDTTP